MKKVFIIIGVILVIAAGVVGFSMFSANRAEQTSADNLQTIPVEIGILTASVGATGKVRADQSAVLTWNTSGEVGEINTSLGAAVTDGQILGTLKQTSLSQGVILAQADLVSAQQALNNLLNSNQQGAQALLAVEDAQLALEDIQLSDVKTAQALLAIDDAQTALDEAFDPALAQANALQAVADAEKVLADAERDLYNLTHTATQSAIDAARADVVLAQNALDKAQDRFDTVANKPETNLIRANLQTQLSAAQQSYDAQVRELNSLLSTGSEIDIAISEANLARAKAQLVNANDTYERIKNGTPTGEVALLEAQLEDAKVAYERIKNGPSEGEIALLETQLADAIREWDRLKDGPDPDDIASAQARVDAAEATLAQVSITAPFDGVVTLLETKPGDQISPGTIAFRVDNLSRMLVDVEVSEVDINQVVVGQQVEVTFDAIFSETYHGEVVEVAMVGSNTSGVVNFEVTVEISDADASVKPGMTASVTIVTMEIKSTMIVPNRAIRVVDGQKGVYTLAADGSINHVPLTLGATSDSYTQVLESTLSEGDLLVLNPPEEGFIFGPGSDGGPRGMFGGN